ncbi:hypothetical protein CMK14_20590 [Candidatus Poribacteria bacterium]|nr:hypothetical protein [Candidatus Poribacteria bacterium]
MYHQDGFLKVGGLFSDDEAANWNPRCDGLLMNVGVRITLVGVVHGETTICHLVNGRTPKQYSFPIHNIIQQFEDVLSITPVWSAHCNH